MAFLVLDIETIPRPTIDESVEEVIAQKKLRHGLNALAMTPKMQNLLFALPPPFLDKFYVLVYAGFRMMELQKIR